MSNSSTPFRPAVAHEGFPLAVAHAGRHGETFEHTGSETVTGESREAAPSRRRPASPTEARNASTSAIDLLPTVEALELLNREDHVVPNAVQQVLPQLAVLVEEAAARVCRGGRVHYFGAGSSGRMALLDAAELAPTFGLEPDVVVTHLAGGERALVDAGEGLEDDEAEGWRDAETVSAADVVIGISASGSTPYVAAALRRSSAVGARTALVTANPFAPLLAAVECPIAIDTGPEALTGSTRLKAASAAKLVLNGFSTVLMIRLGRTFSNLMIDVTATNAKLRERRVRIVRAVTGASDEEAENALREADGDVRLAIVRVAKDLDPDSVCRLLGQTRDRRAGAVGVAERPSIAPCNGAGRLREGSPGAVMASEMAEQPAVLARLVAERSSLARKISGRLPDRTAGIVFLGRGSSHNVAVYARYVFEEWAGLPVSIAAPSLITRYGVRPAYRDWVAVALSQSGETPEIVESLSRLQEGGALGVAVTNEERSALARAADCTVALGAGTERAVPATKTVTGQMLACALLAETVSGRPLPTPALERLPAAVAAALGDDTAAHLGRDLVGAGAIVALARGYLLSAAMETALKIRETSGVPTEAYSSASFLHGSIAAVRPGTPILAFTGDPVSDPDVRAAVELLGRQGARVHELPAEGALAGSSDAAAADATRGRYGAGSARGGAAFLPHWLAPFAATVRGQQVALGLSLALGRNPDRPPGLTKVTPTS